jgi:hypothetical protein
MGGGFWVARVAHIPNGMPWGRVAGLPPIGGVGLFLLMAYRLMRGFARSIREWNPGHDGWKDPGRRERRARYNSSVEGSQNSQAHLRLSGMVVQNQTGATSPPNPNNPTPPSMTSTISYPPSLADLNTLIQAVGPCMQLHAEEKYMMTDPEVLLETSKCTLDWGLVHGEEDYGTFSITEQVSQPVSSGADLMSKVTNATNDPNAGEENFRYWLTVDRSLQQGDQAAAKAYVAVYHQDIQSGGGIIQLQFWMFYAFNGPGKFHLTVGNTYAEDVHMKTGGRHYGDWEHVTVELRVDSSGNFSVTRIYLSRHDNTVWISGLSTFQLQNDRPIIYVAQDSHAHYESAGRHPYKRVAHKNFFVGYLDVDLFDKTGGGGASLDTANPSNYSIIFSDFDSASVSPPDWTKFAKRWGQYEKLTFTYNVPVIGVTAYTFNEVGCGPTGPLQHGTDFGFPAIMSMGARTASVNTSPGSGVNYTEVCLVGTDANLGISGLGGTWINLGAPTAPVTIAAPLGMTTPNVRNGIGYGWVFVQGSDGHLWLSTYDGSNSNWSDLGMPSDQIPVVGSVGAASASNYGLPGVSVVYVQGGDGALWQCAWDGSTGNWAGFGFPLSEPNIVGVGAGCLSGTTYAFIQASDGNLWANGLNSWTCLGCPSGTTVSAGVGIVCFPISANTDGGVLVAYVLGGDGQLYSNTWDGVNPVHWSSLGSPAGVQILSTIGVAVFGDSTCAFVLGDDEHLWLSTTSESGSTWTDHGSPGVPILDAAGVAYGGISTWSYWIAVVRTDDGHCWGVKSDGSGWFDMGVRQN